MYAQIIRPVQRPINWYIEWLYSQILNKFNANIVFNGKPGIGKSDYALETAYWISKKFGREFDPEVGVLFDLAPFFTEIETMPPGSVRILDEAGIDLDNARWMDMFTRMYKYVTETFRYKRIIMLMCLPNLGMLEINQRRLLTAIMHIKFRGRAGFYSVESNAEGKSWAEPFMMVDAHPIPEDHPIRFRYDRMKIAFNETLRENVRKEIEMKRNVQGGMFSKKRFEDIQDDKDDQFSDAKDMVPTSTDFNPDDKVPEWER